jgi:hypothetical protein
MNLGEILRHADLADSAFRRYLEKCKLSPKIELAECVREIDALHNEIDALHNERDELRERVRELEALSGAAEEVQRLRGVLAELDRTGNWQRMMAERNAAQRTRKADQLRHEGARRTLQAQLDGARDTLSELIETVGGCVTQLDVEKLIAESATLAERVLLARNEVPVAPSRYPGGSGGRPRLTESWASRKPLPDPEGFCAEMLAGDSLAVPDEFRVPMAGYFDLARQLWVQFTKKWPIAQERARERNALQAEADRRADEAEAAEGRGRGERPLEWPEVLGARPTRMFGTLTDLVSFLPQPKPMQARKVVSTEQWGLTTGTAFRNVIGAGRQHELLATADLDPSAPEEGGDDAAGDSEDDVQPSGAEDDAEPSGAEEERGEEPDEE